MAQLTWAEADTIIVILLFVVLLLLILGSISLYYNSVFKRRNEQLHRILDALDDYRAIVGDGKLSLDEQEEVVMKHHSELKAKAVKAIPTGEGQSFFVKMDARINKEKPFKDPYFDQKALAEFMEVDLETFRKLLPRYKDPDRTLEYINSLRAEHAAKMIMEHMDYSMEYIASQCGFKNSAAFNSAFKFAFGITPTEYLNGVSQMFKKKKQ